MSRKKLMLIEEVLRQAPKETSTYEAPWGRVWTHGADVMATWKRFGWMPPSEYRNDYYFKVNREGGMA